MNLPMILLLKPLPPPLPPYERAGGYVPALWRPCSFLFEASTVKETKFSLSNSCCSSAAIIGAMQLTIIDAHVFFAMANLG